MVSLPFRHFSSPFTYYSISLHILSSVDYGPTDVRSKNVDMSNRQRKGSKPEREGPSNPDLFDRCEIHVGPSISPLIHFVRVN